jgi:2-polyprenyl-6-hydroxyphenyl methylase/3-demethylubiquinone-9 3-methyltransferase
VIDYRYDTGEALPAEDATFDVAFCCDVLEHVEDVQQAISPLAWTLSEKR